MELLHTLTVFGMTWFASCWFMSYQSRSILQGMINPHGVPQGSLTWHNNPLPGFPILLPCCRYSALPVVPSGWPHSLCSDHALPISWNEQKKCHLQLNLSETELLNVPASATIQQEINSKQPSSHLQSLQEHGCYDWWPAKRRGPRGLNC